MSDPRKQLIESALANMRANPEEWEQGAWRCDTACCFAGHLALAAGWRWAKPVGSYVGHPDARLHHPTRAQGLWHVSTVAAAILTGETLAECEAYGEDPIEFDPENKLEDIERLLRQRGVL